MPLEKKNYDPASPIQNISGLITTERSGIGKWGMQSKTGLIEFCQWLRRAAAALPGQDSVNLVEIGAYAGESTIMFAMVVPNIIAVDPWKNGYDPDDLSSEIFPMEEVERSFAERTAGYPNIKVIKATSEEAVKVIPHGADFVYLDAIHKIGPLRDDIKRWLPRIRYGGYICGHDFCGYWGEVVDAILETIGLPDVRFRDGSWAKRVK